jgi:hypothetical protein
VLQLLKAKVESRSKAVNNSNYTLPGTEGSLITLPRKLKESMLSHGDSETKFISSVGLFSHLWPAVIFIFVPMIPGTVVALLIESSASQPAPSEAPVGDASFIAANLIFVGIGIKILVGCILSVASGLFGKRHFVVTDAAIYSAVTFFGDRGLFLLRRYTTSEFVDRAQLHSNMTMAPRGAWRFLFPDSAITVKPESIFEVNRFPLYINHAKTVYDWMICAVAHDRPSRSSDDAYFPTDAVV